jgi:ADP-ribose pyrophosphatase YjhB (NUDIX family)
MSSQRTNSVEKPVIPTYKNEDKVLLAVDCIIFGFDPGKEELQLLLIKRDFEPEKGKWSLMGGFMKQDETIDQASRRVLHSLTGLNNVYMEFLAPFSELARDPAERTVSMAYWALINIEKHDEELIEKYSANWVDLSKRPELIFDHDEMVKMAIDALRLKASMKPIGFELLPDKFTMRQLLKLHEEIFAQELDKRNFIKKMNSYGFLERLDEKDKQSSKKGSFLYRFNQEKYKEKASNWINFG